MSRVPPNMRLKLSGLARKGVGRCLAQRASRRAAGPLRQRTRRPQLKRDSLGGTAS